MRPARCAPIRRRSPDPARLHTGAVTAPEEELQLLRRALYRPDPPPGTRERYEALSRRLEEQAPSSTTAVALAEAPPPEVPQGAGEQPEPAPSRRRRIATAAVAVVVATGIVVVGLLSPGRGGSAERLEQSLASQDGARLDAALAPDGPTWGPAGAGTTVVDALRRSDLPQLAVWDGREALGWVQRGSGPLHREFGSGREGRPATEPLSIVVRCSTDAVYLWTIRGTAPGSDEVRVLASGDADRCGETTVATGSLPAGSRITSFDLRVPRDVRWTMAVVVPDRD